MSFDARKAKLLPIGEHIIIEDCLGLRLVSSSAGKAWTYRFKSPIDGKMRQIKLGQWPSMPISAAIDEWSRMRDIRALGKDPSNERWGQRIQEKEKAERIKVEKASSEYTVLKLCDDYLRGHIDRNRAPKGAKEIRRMFTTMLDDIAHLQASKLTRTQAFEFLESYLEIPVQCAVMRRELGAAYDYALDAGRLPSDTPNWWRMVMNRKIKSKGKVIRGKNIGTAKRFLSDDELAKVIRWLPNYSKVGTDALTLYLWTCTRGAEICAIHSNEIFEESDGLWWIIPKSKTKNARHEKATDQRVPLVGRAEEIIRRRCAVYAPGYLFPQRGNLEKSIEQKVIQVEVWIRWPDVKRKENDTRPVLDMERWAAHDLRRSARTLLARLGCRDEVAEALLGHMPEGIKSTYNRHTYDNEKREWLTQLADHLERLAALV